MSVARAVQLITAQPVKASGKKKGEQPPPPSAPEAKFAVSYLDAFGYLEKSLSGWKDIKFEDLSKAIGLFQSWFGVKKSYQLDPQTVKAMECPRCGHCDITRKHHVSALAIKEFVNTNLPRWTKNGITYGFASFVPGLTKDVQRQLAAKAFGAWTQYGNLTVSEGGGSTPDIVIGTGQGARSNFDGPGGTLAWAYLPNGSNQQLEMRFDLGETWVANPAQRGILYENVACHEFGHLLGLDHSKVQAALMAPYYNPAIPSPQANDDVPRFQARYGVKTTPTAPPPVAPPAGPRPKVVLTGDIAVELNGVQLN